jgi:hypothetical protein
MLLRLRHKLALLAGAIALAAALAVASTVGGAAAKTVALHFFSKQVYFRLSYANGKPLPPTAPQSDAERISIAGNDYAGDDKQHAKQATASDHFVCIPRNSTPGALCDATFAIGGSMILADDFVFSFCCPPPPQTFKITGGTGLYVHAHGTVIAKAVGKGTDFTIKVSS